MELSAVGIADHLLRGERRLEEHIGQIAAGREHRILGGLPLFQAGILIEGKGEARSFLHAKEKTVGVPVVGAVFSVVAGHGKGVFRHSGGSGGQQQADYAAQSAS